VSAAIGTDASDRRRDTAFTEFFESVEQPLRSALVARFGADRGREGTAEAMAWAWTNRDRLASIDNPLAYLFRVGQSRTRRWFTRPIPIDRSRLDLKVEPWVEPALAEALRQLSRHQRVAVVLAHGFGWTHKEVGELLHISPSSVQNHVERGLAKLRGGLGVEL